MSRPIVINLDQALYVLSGGLDLVGVDDVHHGKRTAYLALRIAEGLPLDEVARTGIFHAALIHDLGVSGTEVHRSLVDELDWERAREHCDAGAALVAAFRPLAHLAGILRHHHTHWDELPRSGLPRRDGIVANLVFLADRVDVIRARRRGEGHPDPDEAVREVIARLAGTYFEPEWVARFLEASAEPSFFANLAPGPLEAWFAEHQPPDPSHGIGLADVRELGRLFAHVVDAKSPFTARHSEGVARLACALARRFGLPAERVALLEVAALLHDLGKLRVPDHILDKAGPLDARERAVMRRHAEDTYELLRRIDGLEEVATWAGLHHETPSGEGYPRSVGGEALSLPARIISVADVFQALAQDRPYRAGLLPGEILAVLDDEARRDRLDRDVVAMVARDVDGCWRAATCSPARRAVPAERRQAVAAR